MWIGSSIVFFQVEFNSWGYGAEEEACGCAKTFPDIPDVSQIFGGSSVCRCDLKEGLNIPWKGGCLGIYSWLTVTMWIFHCEAVTDITDLLPTVHIYKHSLCRHKITVRLSLVHWGFVLVWWWWFVWCVCIWVYVRMLCVCVYVRVCVLCVRCVRWSAVLCCAVLCVVGAGVGAQCVCAVLWFSIICDSDDVEVARQRTSVQQGAARRRREKTNRQRTHDDKCMSDFVRHTLRHLERHCDVCTGSKCSKKSLMWSATDYTLRRLQWIAIDCNKQNINWKFSWAHFQIHSDLSHHDVL